MDISKLDKAKENIGKHVKSTFTENVVLDFGKFGGAFDLSQAKKYKTPVLVTSIDSVGTKLAVASLMNKWDTVGIDLVHHSINDILTTGAKPLFFLDYLAASKINPEIAEQIVKGMAAACKSYKIALLAGETAELPDVYAKNQYDVAGMIGGIVEKEGIVDGKRIKAGDRLIGLASNGLHTNGYSLARKVLFELAKYNVDDYAPELKNTIGDELLKTHKCYFDSVYPLLGKFEIKGMAHITGGGFNNILRVVPKNLGVKITKNWETPAIFRLIKERGDVPCEDMRRTFNMGIGFALIVSPADAENVLKKIGKDAQTMGEVVSKAGVEFVENQCIQ